MQNARLVELAGCLQRATGNLREALRLLEERRGRKDKIPRTLRKASMVMLDLADKVDTVLRPLLREIGQ